MSRHAKEGKHLMLLRNPPIWWKKQYKHSEWFKSAWMWGWADIGHCSRGKTGQLNWDWGVADASWCVCVSRLECTGPRGWVTHCYKSKMLLLQTFKLQRSSWPSLNHLISTETDAAHHRWLPETATFIQAKMAGGCLCVWRRSVNSSLTDLWVAFSIFFLGNVASVLSWKQWIWPRAGIILRQKYPISHLCREHLPAHQNLNHKL